MTACASSSSGAGTAGSVLGAATSAPSASNGYRVTHDTGFTYPGGGGSTERQIVPGSPTDDFPDITHLNCAHTGKPVAMGTIHNTTSSTNDYMLVVKWYPGHGPSATVGSEIATTYVEVYGVPPGGKTQYTTAEAFGQKHANLSGDNFCTWTVAERYVSLSTSSNAGPPPSDLCGVLSVAEIQQIAAQEVRSNSTNTGYCSWDNPTGTWSLSIVQTKPTGAMRYTETFAAPCPGGKFGYQEGTLVAVCTGGKSHMPFYITFSNPETENQTPPPASNPYQAQQESVAKLIGLAMQRA